VEWRKGQEGRRGEREGQKGRVEQEVKQLT
jgi:hypothetical protein